MAIDEKALKRVMLQKRLTNKELSEKSGVSKVTLNKIIKGETIPRLETVYSLADALEVEPEILVKDI